MKAPDKIYISRYSYGGMLSGWSENPRDMADGENIEYIKVSALKDWLHHIKRYDDEVAIESVLGKIDTL